MRMAVTGLRAVLYAGNEAIMRDGIGNPRSVLTMIKFAY